MTRPMTTVVQMPYRNPDASAPLIVPVLVLCNTPDEELESNITINSAREGPWVSLRPAHDMTAILCGGGPSLADHIDEIIEWQKNGAVVFAMNGASRFLRERGVTIPYQVISDAKPETATLVDPFAINYLLASQVHPETFKAAEREGRSVTLWHLGISETMDNLFPAHRVKAGNYTLIGGGQVGCSALCLAYVRGFRRFECYGYDSSHRGEASHAYRQDMNQFIPVCEVSWAGTKYRSSIAMKGHAEKFQIVGQQLKRLGCTINVHGDGLLPAMWNTQEKDLTECDKYRLLWQTDTYRAVSPGESCVPLILERLQPKGMVIDFGCGTGRASIALSKAGCDMFLIDFADNCRDEEAMNLPFLEWDLTSRCPAWARFGICTDVMEHLPPDDVRKAIENIMLAADSVFFQISTTEDHCGALIGHHLHLTVQTYHWWLALFDDMGYAVSWSANYQDHCCFVIRRDTARSE